jgi:hypothetical protein
VLDGYIGGDGYQLLSSLDHQLRRESPHGGKDRRAFDAGLYY